MPAVFKNRRPKLASGRRIDMHAVISSEIMAVLETIGNGNRSAAIEYLVRHYMADQNSKIALEAAT